MKSWLIAIPFESFPIVVIVFRLIVMSPLVVVPEAMVAIALSLSSVIVLSVASSVKFVVGVAKTSAEPPLLDMVFVEAATSRVVKAPDVCR